MLEKNLENKEKYLDFVRKEMEHIKKSLAELQLMENKEQKKQKSESHFEDDVISKIHANVERLVNDAIRAIDKQTVGLG
jgi:ribosome recycling factor